MSIVGTWKITVSTPMGDQEASLVFNEDGTGNTTSRLGSTDFEGATIDADTVTFALTIDIMGQKVSMDGSATADGDSISGTYKSQMGESAFSGTRAR